MAATTSGAGRIGASRLPATPDALCFASSTDSSALWPVSRCGQAAPKDLEIIVLRRQLTVLRRQTDRPAAIAASATGRENSSLCRNDDSWARNRRSPMNAWLTRHFSGQPVRAPSWPSPGGAIGRSLVDDPGASRGRTEMRPF